MHVTAYDFLRYRRFIYRRGSEAVQAGHMQAMMTMEAHAIEKGFCFPEPHLGYGSSRIRLLLRFMRQYRDAGFDCSHFAFRNAQSVLSAYLNYHEENSYDLGALRTEILPWAAMADEIGGYKVLLKEDVLKQAEGNFESCAMSRYSIRNFSSISVPLELIRGAVRVAQKSPSVCNRQSWHVYVIKDPELKEKALTLQNGNRGFGHTADFVAVITSDLQTFASAEGRNQCFVDGGLFSMSLMYALHSRGVGTCPLNWMVSPEQDRKLRKVASIKPSENIIMMMVGGFLPKTLRVPKSARPMENTVITIISSGL